MKRAALCLVLLVLGVVGGLSLLLLPISGIDAAQLGVDPAILPLLVLIQPLMLTIIGVGTGCALAHRVGLGAPFVSAILARASLDFAALRRAAIAAIAVALAGAVVLIWFYAFTGQTEIMGSDAAPSLVTRVLYGGITEELMVRWGLMSFLLWVIWRLRGRPVQPGATSAWIAISIAALIFGAGHLPVAFATFAEVSPILIGAILVGNFLPGVGFGWLFWKHGIEAAILGHALTHIFAAVWWALF